jgi:hypothetical protein
MHRFTAEDESFLGSCAEERIFYNNCSAKHIYGSKATNVPRNIIFSKLDFSDILIKERMFKKQFADPALFVVEDVVLFLLLLIYMMYFVNCNWVDTRWQ